jgi:hypothetical protein
MPACVAQYGQGTPGAIYRSAIASPQKRNWPFSPPMPQSAIGQRQASWLNSSSLLGDQHVTVRKVGAWLALNVRIHLFDELPLGHIEARRREATVSGAYAFRDHFVRNLLGNIVGHRLVRVEPKPFNDRGRHAYMRGDYRRARFSHSTISACLRVRSAEPFWQGCSSDRVSRQTIWF